MNNKIRAIGLWLGAFLAVTPTRAEVSTLPVSDDAPLVGIVYPAFTLAVLGNPATIAQAGAGTAVMVMAEPSQSSLTPNTLTVSGAGSTKNLGVGVGFQRQQNILVNSTGAFAGIGYNGSPLSLGLTVNHSDLSSAFSSAQYNLGVTFGQKSGLKFAIVGYGITASPTLVFGMGYSDGKKASVEWNLQLPSLNTIGQSAATYRFSVITNIAPGAVAWNLGATLLIPSYLISPVIGASWWVTKNVNVLAQIASGGTYQAAMVLAF